MRSAQNRYITSGEYSDPGTSPNLILQFLFGLNENPDPDAQECSAGYNFELAYADRSLRPRLPFDLSGTAPNGGAITGIMQLIKRDNTETTLVCAGTAVYKWNGASTWTSKGTVTAPARLRDCYYPLTDQLIITDINLNNVVKSWDGTTFGNLTTGLTKPLKAKYGVIWQDRVWLFNINYDGTNYPHMVLVSQFENPNSYDTAARGGPTSLGGGTFTTGMEAFYILTPDLKPINGVTTYQNSLVISTLRGRIFQLTGNSSSTYQMQDFYDVVPPIGDEGFSNIGNDAIYVKPGGGIV